MSRYEKMLRDKEALRAQFAGKIWNQKTAPRKLTKAEKKLARQVASQLKRIHNIGTHIACTFDQIDATFVVEAENLKRQVEDMENYVMAALNEGYWEPFLAPDE
ncbi:MAG: hypothetical protein V4721_00585 [Bacteroidota bacterium]